MAGSIDRVLLSAVLIVRDEAFDIVDCLRSLRDVVDQVVVYDTGSVDDTRDLARAAGATVVEGYWDDDFARARNDAALAAGGDWLLVIDADERLVADRDPVRALLTQTRVAAGFSVQIDNVAEADDGSAGYLHWGNRVLRRVGARWAGAVHEQPVTVDGTELALDTMPPHLLALQHLGYSDPERFRRKSERNARLAQAQLDALASTGEPDPAVVAGVLLNLGRSLIGVGRTQDAVDTFELIREIAAGTPAWAQATDHLARVLLAAGHDELVVLLSEQLRSDGADNRYCDWLRAQALAQLGHPQEALTLIRGVSELVDPAGRHYDLGQVLEVRSLLAAMLGLQDEALATLTLAVARYGRIRGRGRMLLELWGTAPAIGLATVVRQSGSPALFPAVADELRGSGGAGPAVAAALVG